MVKTLIFKNKNSTVHANIAKIKFRENITPLGKMPVIAITIFCHVAVNLLAAVMTLSSKYYYT